MAEEAEDAAAPGIAAGTATATTAESATEATSGRDTFVGIVVVPALLVGIFFLFKALFPADLPEASDPNFIDTIFNNKGVIWAARLLLVSAGVVLAVGGVFIISSTVIRMKNGDWLKRAGPFEVSENALVELENQIEFWRTAALEGQEEISELRELLEESDELIEQLHLAMDDG
jgi:hypothetical protein